VLKGEGRGGEGRRREGRGGEGRGGNGRRSGLPPPPTHNFWLRHCSCVNQSCVENKNRNISDSKPAAAQV